MRDADDAVLATFMWLAVGAPLYFVRRRRSLARSLLRRGTA
jgi:hypothetical protein